MSNWGDLMTGRDETLGFSDDDRALAFNIGLFFGTIIIGFLLAIVLEPASDGMLDIAGNMTSRGSSEQGIQYVRAAWTNLHLIVIGFGMVQLIVAAAYEANLGGGF